MCVSARGFVKRQVHPIQITNIRVVIFIDDIKLKFK